MSEQELKALLAEDPDEEERRRYGLWLLLLLLVFLCLCGVTATPLIMLGLPPEKIDAGVESQLDADYATWPAQQFPAVDPVLIGTIQADQRTQVAVPRRGTVTVVAVMPFSSPTGGAVAEISPTPSPLILSPTIPPTSITATPPATTTTAPTNTTQPSATPDTPVATNTAIPTSTTAPTSTPIPTSTSIPTDTPVPPPPPPAPLSADVRLTKSDSPDPVAVGGILTYTLTATNNGPDPAQGVSLTDTLPGGVTFGSATTTRGSCSQAGGIVSCNLGNMGNGATATITITVTPGSAGTITNSANAKSSTTDPNTGNNSASASTTVVTASPPIAIDDGPEYTPQNTAITIDVPDNDSDPDGNLDLTSVVITSGPTNGNVVINPTTGEITYTPDPGYYGSDTFTYRIYDATGLWDEAIVTVEDPVGSGADGEYLDLTCGSSVIYELGTAIDLTTSDAAYDLEFYEFYNSGGPGVYMDHIQIEIYDSVGGTWITIFNWGDGVEDTHTSLSPYVTYGLPAAETDNFLINGSPPLIAPSGIGINLDAVAGLTGNIFQSLRLSIPASVCPSDASEIDGFIVNNP